MSNIIATILPFIVAGLLLTSGCKPESETRPIDECVGLPTDANAFELMNVGITCRIVYDSCEFSGVRRVAAMFANDLKSITGETPTLSENLQPTGNEVLVFVGTIGRSHFIDTLVNAGKLDASKLLNRWETSLVQVVEKPFTGIDRALVIAGSDKRGTIYGMFSLSRALGVSPWYWWADVPVRKRDAIFIKPGIYSDGEPKVKYRGIFINDEAPALSGWAYEKYGGFNSQMYSHVFELILRLKGNFLWPAMWGRAFYVDDTLNPALADELGIVIGTSHHEPMMRAHAEWKMFGTGPWSYEKNPQVLDEFWRGGYKRMGSYESIVTLGMRGDGDEPMSAESNIALLESIVKRQREIIAEVSGKPVEQQPQVWALYKEVLDYYKKGMRVPDDVTLLLCDDNWGNVRILPNEAERSHKGGYGMYYHFDYVGGPRNYKWLNTNSIPRIWEQMYLCYTHGVDRIWIVNVGDIKPMELPISFFLDYAWNPEKMSIEKMMGYTCQWAAEQFGPRNAQQIGQMLDAYTWYNSRRKPEMLDSATYSLLHYREFERVVNDYRSLETEAELILQGIPDEQRDAYFQLVLFPIKACANLNALHYTVARNHLYYKQRRALTNPMAMQTGKLFAVDSLLTWQYNHQLSNGKWNHFMNQTHIGYTYWQQPDRNIIPKTRLLALPDSAQMGVWVEGDTAWFPGTTRMLRLPTLYRYGGGTTFFEIYNRGRRPFLVRISPSHDWISISEGETIEVAEQVRVEVGINWERVPVDPPDGFIRITDPYNRETLVGVTLDPQNQKGYQVVDLVSANRLVCFNAASYSAKRQTKGIRWVTIPRAGKMESGVTAIPPQSFDTVGLSDNPYLQYTFTVFDTGDVRVHLMFCPTLDFKNKDGLLYAIALDNQKPLIVNMHRRATTQDYEKWVGDNIIKNIVPLRISRRGAHSLRYIMIDEGLVLQKIVIDQGGLRPSYLGPNESLWVH